jgi:PAS domain-containing protein
MVRSGIPGKETKPRNKAAVVFSILIPLLAAILLFVVIHAKLRGVQLPDFVIFIEALGFVVVILAGTWFLIRGVREHRESEERYRQMASHIEEIFWMLDAESKRVLEVNEAYETITGRTRSSLLDNPTSYEGDYSSRRPCARACQIGRGHPHGKIRRAFPDYAPEPRRSLGPGSRVSDLQSRRQNLATRRHSPGHYRTETGRRSSC